MKSLQKWLRQSFLLALITATLMEGLLRLPFPAVARLSAQVVVAPGDANVPYQRVPGMVYELVPSGFVDLFNETLNNEGFRGPNYSKEKPKNTYRILALGDSTVLGFSTPFDSTWEELLKKDLERRFAGASRPLTIEVINTGIGGYQSWQALARLQLRAIAYKPDLVIVDVGWNDLLFSSSPQWREGYSLANLVDDYAQPPPQKTGWEKIRHSLYDHVRLAQAVRNVRNIWWNRAYLEHILTQRSVASSTSFNDRALALYLKNLDAIHDLVQSSGAAMAVVMWPTLLTERNLASREVRDSMKTVLMNFPLGIPDYLSWHGRYMEALAQWAQRHPHTDLFDWNVPFKDELTFEARQKYFVDQAHFSKAGHQRLADYMAPLIEKKLRSLRR